MTITKGFWKTRNGQKAEVVDVRNSFAIGWLCDGPHKWRMDGVSSLINDYNLTEPWIDKPEWDWSTTPSWLNWLAMDDPNYWYLYGHKPTLSDNGFSAAAESDDVWFVPKKHAPKWSGDRKDSLVCRPGLEVKP